jgi:hypothetical protein
MGMAPPAADTDGTPTPPRKQHPRRGGRPRLAPRPPTMRSRTTNGNRFLDNIDGRSTEARRMYDITAQIAQDLGGVDRITETRLHLIRRFATLCVLLEQREVDVAGGKPINESAFAKQSSVLCRLAHRIGLKRIPKTVTQDLREYIAPSVEATP